MIGINGDIIFKENIDAGSAVSDYHSIIFIKTIQFDIRVIHLNASLRLYLRCAYANSIKPRHEMVDFTEVSSKYQLGFLHFEY